MIVCRWFIASTCVYNSFWPMLHVLCGKCCYLLKFSTPMGITQLVCRSPGNAVSRRNSLKKNNLLCSEIESSNSFSMLLTTFLHLLRTSICPSDRLYGYLRHGLYKKTILFTQFRILKFCMFWMSIFLIIVFLCLATNECCNSFL